MVAAPASPSLWGLCGALGARLLALLRSACLTSDHAAGAAGAACAASGVLAGARGCAVAPSSAGETASEASSAPRGSVPGWYMGFSVMHTGLGASSLPGVVSLRATRHTP